MAGPWRIRTRKPNGNVRVDFSNPLARDIAFFYYNVAGTTFYDAVTGILAGTATGQTTNSQGGLAFNGSARSTSTTAWRNPNGTLDNKLTVAAGLMLNGKPAGICFPVMYGTGFRGVGPVFNSSGFAGGGILSSSGFPVSVDAVDHTGQYVVINSTSDGGTSGTAIGFVNGVKQVSASGGSNGTQAPSNLWLGRDGTGYNNNFNGVIYWTIGWNRLLTDAENVAIAKNPWQLLLPQPDLGWLSLDTGGGGDVTVALIGSAATSAAGALSTSSLITVALVGTAGTASAGTISPAVSFALSGSAATASAGTLGKASLITIGLTGSAATGVAGSVSVAGDKTIAITGSSATAAAGTLGINLSKALSGQSVTASPGTLSRASLITIALTGSQMTCASGTMTASGGTQPSIWTPATPASGIWTPTTDSTDVWTPQTASAKTWTPQ